MTTLQGTKADYRLSELLDRAAEHRRTGRSDQAILDLCTAVEVAYGMGQLPDELWQRLDRIVSAGSLP